MIIEQLRSDLTAAMKARDTLTTSTLRMVLAKVKEAEVSGSGARTLDDDEVLKVIAREVKVRDEAFEGFTAAGRAEKVAQEQAEKEILQRYLPAPLTDDELAEIVTAELTAAGLATPKDMGAAMKLVNAKVAGRAEGKKVAALVKAQLSR